jgi:S1-C subfamily serine protease
VSLDPNGPAGNAGVRTGDRIVSFNGQPVSGIDALQLLLTEQQVGVPSQITVLRLTEKLEFQVVPVLSPSSAQQG